MNRFTKLIYLAFGVSMLIIFIIALNYYRRLERTEYYINRISHTSNTILVLEHVNSLFQRSANAFRNYLITGDTSYSFHQRKDWMLALHQLDSLAKLTGDDLEQQQQVGRLRSLFIMRSAVMDTLVKRMRQSGNVDVNYFLQLEGIKSNIESALADIGRHETRLLEERKVIKAKFENYSFLFLAILLGFTAIVVSASFYSLLRALKKRTFFERQLREKIVNLNMANRELENLSRATSHHIQEPLRKIRSLASLMRTRNREVDRDDGKLLLEKIEGNAENLQTLAHNLVQYANLIQCTQEKEPVDLNILVRQVEDRLEDKLIATNGNIMISPLPTVSGVPEQLAILLYELVCNALNFAREKTGVTVSIYPLPTSESSKCIVVEDNGIGFSQQYGERIFRLFERLEPMSQGGKGVGLAMCARVMANHGGTIRAEGVPGQGAKFIMEFPAGN